MDIAVMAMDEDVAVVVVVAVMAVVGVVVMAVALIGFRLKKIEI